MQSKFTHLMTSLVLGLGKQKLHFFCHLWRDKKIFCSPDQSLSSNESVQHRLFRNKKRGLKFHFTFFQCKNIFENVHRVREEEATWSGRLTCPFFLSLPSGIRSSPRTHHGDVTLYSPKQPLHSALHSKMSGLVILNNAGKQMLLLWVM